MNFYTQPENELILSVLLDEGELAVLKSYLRDQEIFEDVSERVMAFDQAFDPHAVVEALRHHKLVVKVAQGTVELGKTAVTAAVVALVKDWVQNRNDKKKAEIEAKQTEPLFFDQYGHRLDIRPESKKTK